MSFELTFEEAFREGETRILFTGPRRSGKSSIEKVIFHKMSPHETLFLDSTQQVEIHEVSHNDCVKFQTWDFGGDLSINGEVSIFGTSVLVESIIKCSQSLIYVIDAQEDDYEDQLPKLVETLVFAYQLNPNMHFEVFLNKIDGDNMSEETKAEKQQNIQRYVSYELAEKIEGDLLVGYYLTSIYDHSALEAFSKVKSLIVVQKLIPQLLTLNSLLDILIASCNVDKCYLVDVVSKLYLASDSNPVDVHTYELCSDLVDVVIDVSGIYQALSPSQSLASQASDPLPYDSESSSVIRLASGMVLYLRQVSGCLALVCVLREEFFQRRALLDYNVNCFKASLGKVLERENRKVY